MLLRGTRRVQILPLLCAVCHLTLSFPVQTPPAHEDVRQLQVNIPHSGPVLTPLGSSISIPCFVSLSSTSSSPVVPRIKWTVVSGGVETQILVARGQRVKINDAYRDRAALFNYTSSPDDASLWLGDLRHSDSGYYRCEVQQGLEDASDIIRVKVKGVVFHYRDTLGRYAFSFQQAQRACGAIGARIATPDQLLAAYYDGYEQCDAGWLADQSVRYPIQVPREGCYGDMDGQPGVRNYGTMDPKDLYDVYCYIEQIDGEVFHDFIPQQLSFDEAWSYCEAADAELATTAQLYFAWSEGLDRCSPGWLADGSVRYPIVTPRERCGGPQAGVKTLYRFSNQTGFPEPFRLHDVYCFKEKRKTSSDSPVDSVFTETEDAEQNVIFFMEKDQEIQLHQQAEQVEREVQSVLESLPVLSSPFTVETLADTHPTVTPDIAESSPSTSALHLLQLINETSETSLDSEHPTEVMNTTISETEPYNSTQSISFSLGVYNQTDLQSNLSFTFLHSEIERTTYKPHTENQTGPGLHFEETTYLPGKRQVLQNTSLSFERLHTNYNDTESNYTREESFWEATASTVDPLLQVKLEEAAVVDPKQISLSTQATQETHSSDVTQTTVSAIETLTSLWDYMDGSGDVSREKDVKVEEVTKSHSATDGFTMQPFTSVSRSPAEQTIPPDVTFSPGSHYVDTASSEIFFTSPHLWESSVSRQEGSTSFETGDMEAEEMQSQTTHSLKWVVSEVSSTTTETPEGLNTSQSPSEFATTQNQTSGYILHFDSSSSAEDVSGYEPRTDNSSFQEDNKFVLASEEQTTFSPTSEEETNVSIFMDDVKIASTNVPNEVKVITTIFLKEEETNVTLRTDKETKVASTMTPEEGAKAVSTFVLEESAKVTQTFVLEEGAKVMPTKVVPTFEEESKAPTFTDLDNEVSVAPITEEKVSVVSTHVHEKEAKVAPTLEEETKAPSFSDLEDEVGVAPITEEKVSVFPTYVPDKEAKVTQTLVFEVGAKVTPTKVVPTLKEEAKAPSFIDLEDVAPITEEKVSVVPTHVLEEESKIVPILDFDKTAKVAPTIEEEAKVLSSLDEEESSAPTNEDVKFAPTPFLKEDTEVVPTVVLEEVKVAPTIVLKETAKVDPTLEEEAKVLSPLNEEKTSVAPVIEDVKVAPTLVLKEDTKAIPTVVLEDIKIAPTIVFKEKPKVDPTLDSQKAEISSTHDSEEEASAAPTMEEEVKVVPTFVLKEYTEVVPTIVLEEGKISPTIVLEETAQVDPTLDSQKAEISSTHDSEEEASAAPTMEEEVKVVPTFVLKEYTEVVPTIVLDKAKISPTIVLEETAKVDPTLDLQEAKRPSTYDLEEEASAAPTMEEEVEVVPTFVLKEYTEVVPTNDLEETANFDTTIDSQEAKLPSIHDLEEEASTAPTMEEEVKVSPTFVIEEVKVAPTHSLEENKYIHVATSLVTDKEAKVAPTFVTENIKVAPTSDFEEETTVVPTYADFSISPLSSQTSKWTLRTTPTEPQESLIDVGLHQRPSAKEVSDLLTVQLSTKPTAAAVKTVSPTITTTTHRSRHIWSSTTARPKSFHETIELQKVTHVIPPVDHGLVDLELGLTKPPTLLILPNERAAVGGAGKYSDVCLDDPCLNGGTCTEQDGQIRCLCLPTYGGVFCQTDLERCDLGWDKFHGFCYRHFSQRQSWEVAEQHCRMQGAHLVSIMSPEEQDYINSNYKEYQWTGLNDKTIEDDFRWSDGNPLLYENWYRGQPDSYFLSGEDCVVMVWHDSGRWSDVPCNYHLAYTCKKGTSSCGPPPKVPNASIFGKLRQRYETGTVVRYHCTKGFQQRLNPLIKCLSGGHWQRPQIRCTPEAGGIMQHPEELSLIDSNFAAAENELEATKETPQYWDIKF